MVRLAAAILALFVLTGEARAQQRHTVVNGETLWGLAQRYYNDPWRWPRIYEANRAPSGEVEDAHWIYPGEVIVIPEIEATPVVAGVAVVPGGPAPAAPAAPMAPVEPERTVFYSEGGSGSGFSAAAARANRIAVPRDVSVSAPWLGPVGRVPPNLGRVTEFAGADDELVVRTTALPFDRVTVSLPGLSAPRGTELLAFRAGRVIPEAGTVLIPTGVLAVSDPTPEGAVALVVTVFDKLNVGDYVQMLPSFALRPGMTARPVTDGAGATILGFAGQNAIQGLNDIAFLDQGADQGVAIGDEYVLVWNEGDGSPPEVEGRLQVVQVHPDHASARITWMRNPVFQPGGVVGLDLKMP